MPWPTGLVVKNGLKILSRFSARDAHAGVGHGEGHGVVAFAARLDLDVAPGRRGVERVHEQGEERLAELAVVRGDARQARGRAASEIVTCLSFIWWPTSSAARSASALRSLSLTSGLRTRLNSSSEPMILLQRKISSSIVFR